MRQELLSTGEKKEKIKHSAFDSDSDSKSQDAIESKTDAVLSSEPKAPTKTIAVKTTPSSEVTTTKRKNKPKWAQTAENCTDEKEVGQDDKENESNSPDETELLNFVDNLDFSKYVADVEIQIMVEKVRKRIQELEYDIRNDELIENESKEKELKRQQLEVKDSTEIRMNDSYDLSLGDKFDSNSDDDDDEATSDEQHDEDSNLISAAKRLYYQKQNQYELESLYSKKSIHQVYKSMVGVGTDTSNENKDDKNKVS